MKRPGDSVETHQRKCDDKRKELERRGFSEAQIDVYMRHWDKFDCRTHNKRMNDAKKQTATDRRP